MSQSNSGVQVAAPFNQAINDMLSVGLGNRPNTELGDQVMRMESGASPAFAAARQGVEAHLQKLTTVLAAGRASEYLDAEGKDATHASFKSPFKHRMESHVKADAMAGFAMAQNPAAWSGRTLSNAQAAASKAETVIMQPAGMSGGTARVHLRQEAFRDVDLNASMVFSMGYGASITKQTDFVMGWYSPIMIDPNQASIQVRLNLLTVFNGVIHDTDTGNLARFARRNVARSLEDPNILNRYATLAYPIWTDGRKAHFVDTAVVPAHDEKFGNRVIHSNYLKYGNDFNVLGLGTTAATLETSGKPTHRETLEAGAKLSHLLIKSGDDLIDLPTLNLRTMNFIGTQQYDQQETTLQGNITLGLSGSKLKTRANGALTGPLKFLADNKLRMTVQVRMNGQVNIETGNANVQQPTFRLTAVEDMESGEVYEPGSSTYDQVETAVKGFENLGFKFLPFKTNSTKREQGDRINTRRFVFQYMAPYRDPISVERMVDTKGEHDAQDLTNLMGLTKIRIENEAVDHMFEMFDLMRAYVDMNAGDATLADLPGLAQFYLIPVFHEEKLHMPDHVDSIKSHERAEDIQAYLVMKLRDVSTRLLTFSQWKAAMIVQNNDTLPPPQINIFTDPIIARYLLAPGDLRTMGDYDYVVTTTLNRRMKGKIALSFRIPGQEASNTVQIFGWGHLLTSAEMVFAANMFRNNDYFSELQVTPRYDFLPMNLMGALFEVTGVPEVLSKIPGYTTLKGTNNVEVVMNGGVAPTPAPNPGP